MKRAALTAAFVVLVGTACLSRTDPAPPATVHPTASTAPIVPTPTVAATVSPFTLEPVLHVNDDPAPIGERYVANGDETLTFRIDFFADMDHGSVVRAVQASAAAAINFRWQMGDASVLFDVPPGNSALVIDPTGAHTASGSGAPAGRSWRIERPRTELAFYAPSDVAAGVVDPVDRTTFGFLADRGCSARFDPAIKTALMCSGPPRRELSFIDLATGARRATPWDINKIASNGAAEIWLPDGRLLVLGSHDTIIAGPHGENMRWLPTAQPGQTGSVSPSGHEVALWSYTKNDLSVLDIDAGIIRTIGADLKRCSAYFNASVTWSPSGRTIAAGYCTEDLGGEAATAFFDAATGRRVGTLHGWTVVAWLPDGRLLGRAWEPVSAVSPRKTKDGLAVFDASGELIGWLDVEYHASVSPDGAWLLEIEPDPHGPHTRLVDTRSGRAYEFLSEDVFPSWTPDGRIAVIRQVR